MDFELIESSNPEVLTWKAVDMIGGFEVIVTEIAPNSGCIAKVIDAFSGEEMKKYIGSTVESTAFAAREFCEKMTLSGVIAAI